MEEQNNKERIGEIEELILQLPAIISCKIVIGDENQIIEIHILSSNRRSPKQIVRDIQSALMAQWELEIDHKIISVAQISDDMEQTSAARLTISRVEYAIEGIHAHAQVILKHENKLYTGQENGLHTSNGSLMLIANAALRAVEEYLGIGHCFAIEDVEKTLLAKKKVMTVAVTLLTPYDEKYFVGSSFVHSDENKSVVRATLDALNRLVEKQ